MKQTHTVPKSLGYVCVYFVKVYILCSQITLYIGRRPANSVFPLPITDSPV